MYRRSNEIGRGHPGQFGHGGVAILVGDEGRIPGLSLEEAWKCDLMLICGTSAVVFPFANLPRVARQARGATIIEVNAEPTPLTEEGISDYLIQGKTGEILPAIVEETKKIKRDD